MCVEVLLVYPGASYLLHQQSYRAGRSGFKSSHSYKLSVFFVFFFPLLFFAPACLSQSSDSIFARASPSTSCVEDRAVKCHALLGFLYTHTHTHLTHTCRQAGSPLYLKALIPCHSPVPCCHALCGLPLNGLARSHGWEGPSESAGRQLSL